MKKTESKSTDHIGFLHTHSSYVTVYIGNLSFKKTPAQLKTLFQKFGPVSYVNVVKDPKTSKSKGFAFIQMKSTQAASKAIKELNGSILDGRTLKVSIANQRFKPEDNFEKANFPKTVKPTVRRRDKKKGLNALKSFLNTK